MLVAAVLVITSACGEEPETESGETGDPVLCGESPLCD